MCITYLFSSPRQKECMDKKCMFVTHSKSENETDRCARACTSKVNLFGMQTHARSSSHRNVYGDCYLSIYVWCW